MVSHQCVATFSMLDANGNIVATLRAVNVTVQYYTPQMSRAKTYVLTSFVSQFR